MGRKGSGKSGGGGYSGKRSSFSKSGMYTSSGKPVYNPAAYAAAGGKSYTSSGRAVSNPTAYSGAIEASVRQNTSTPKYLYHYTDKSSAAKIKSSGHIRPSTGSTDCALGEGTYMTAQQPRSSDASLLGNIY